MSEKYTKCLSGKFEQSESLLGIVKSNLWVSLSNDERILFYHRHSSHLKYSPEISDLIVVAPFPANTRGREFWQLQLSVLISLRWTDFQSMLVEYLKKNKNYSWMLQNFQLSPFPISSITISNCEYLLRFEDIAGDGG